LWATRVLHDGYPRGLALGRSVIERRYKYVAFSDPVTVKTHLPREQSGATMEPFDCNDRGLMRLAAILDWTLRRIALPLLALSTASLHIYTAYSAFHLATTKLWGCAAALAAWVTPGIAQLVVSYYAWRASGSMVNAYSFWLLAWVGLLFAVQALMAVDRRFGAQRKIASLHTSPQTPVHLG
jgi:hypothetical protein